MFGHISQSNTKAHIQALLYCVCYAPQHRGKLLVCKNLLINKGQTVKCTDLCWASAVLLSAVNIHTVISSIIPDLSPTTLCRGKPIRLILFWELLRNLASVNKCNLFWMFVVPLDSQTSGVGPSGRQEPQRENSQCGEVSCFISFILKLSFLGVLLNDVLLNDY